MSSSSIGKRKTSTISFDSQKKTKRNENHCEGGDEMNSNSSVALRNSTSNSNNGLRKKVTSPQQPTKKLVIKFDVKPQLPAKFEEETWLKLQETVRAVHQKKSTAYSLEELYQAVQSLCNHKMSASLYSKLQKECQDHIIEEGQKLEGQNADPVIFLMLVANTWQDHCQHMALIRNIFLYLDRTYVIQNTNIRSIWDMGLHLFRQHVVLVPAIESKIVNGLLSLIQQDRKRESVDRSLVKTLLRMFVALQIYAENFEKSFLEHTAEFYAKEGTEFLQENDIAEYLRHVENRLQEENERVFHYLDNSTRKPLISLVEKQLLETHISAILEKGFDNLMDENRRHDLNRLYQLFSRVNGLERLKVTYNAYIKRTGCEIVSPEERDKTMVQDLLDFKAKLDAILEEAFSRNEAFAYSLKEAFEFFINVRQNKPAELIAKFIDGKLRSGNKAATEEELETLLDKLMTLFRYIQGKDVFEAFYKKDLAKRLLLGKSASFDLEKAMIAKLKTECGSIFTNKLEGMFKDMDLSKDIMTSFRQSKRVHQLGDIELNVFVLTTGYWPAYTPGDVKLPQELAEYQEIFKTFYLSKYNGRRLMWQNSLGYCVLKANFPLGRKELSVSLFQSVVLLLFQDVDKLSYKDILEGTGIEEKELKRTLQSLACGKARVLLKQPKGRDVDDTDTFSFNSEFKQKLFRIKINSIQMKEKPEENQKTTEGVFQDRLYQIDAAIVRIMKTRRTLSHQLLMTELYQQLKFPLKPADMKKRIESLIDREYLERDTTNSQVYHYLA